MTEPTSSPAYPPAPGSPGPQYQPEPAPPAYPAGAAPAYPGGPAPAYPPGYPAAGQPGAPGQPGVPGQPGAPGQPGLYPTSAMPASAMPASAMPMSAYPAYVAPGPRLSPWIWVLAAVSVVLLLVTSALGLALLGGQDRISQLEQTVAGLEKERDDLREARDDLVADLADAHECLDAFDAWWAAPVGDDEDEWMDVIDACR